MITNDEASRYIKTASDVIEGNKAADINELLQIYDEFHRAVENTPDWLPTKGPDWNKAFHAAVGMSGESGEILDLFKKELFGKNIPIERGDLTKELGDEWWYMYLMMRSINLPFSEMLARNIIKLAMRYAR